MVTEHDPTEGVSLVRRLLVALVSTVCRFPRLVLALSLVLCGLSVLAACTRLQYHTQRDDLISAHKECQQRWRNYLDEFGDDDDIVAVVRGTDPEPMKAALDDLAERLQTRPDLFDRLFYRVDLRNIRPRALLLLPTEQVRTIHGELLRDMRRLLDSGSVGWHALGLLTLTQEANARALALQPDQSLSSGDDRFFAQYQAVCRAASASLADPSAYRDPWGSMTQRPSDPQDVLEKPRYFFSGDGRLAFLLVRPIKEAGSFTAALKSVRAAREMLAEVQANHPSVEIGLTGMPVLETDEMVAAEHDTRLASWLAIAGVSLLFLAAYRRVYYPILTVATLLTGTAWAMGWLTVTVGHLNILSATFAVMLIGMGDYGVLWVMRYEQARRDGRDVRSALLHTTVHVAIGNLTAASTLALAFFAAMFADFKAVAELGWIAGCGVVLCAFACFTVLPALLMLFDRRPTPLQIADCRLQIHRTQRPSPPTLPYHSAICNPQSAIDRDVWLPWLGRRPGLVLAGGLALALVLGFCATRVRYDHNLLHLQAQGLDSVKWEMILIEHTAGASWHALSYRRSASEALELAERYKALPGVSQVVEVASLVPPGQEEKLPLLREIQSVLASLPRRGAAIPHARTDKTWIQDELATLRQRLSPLSQGPRVLDEVRSAVQGLQDRLASLDAEIVANRLQQFDSRLAEGLAENLHCLRDVSHPVEITLADLPDNLRERYVGKSGYWLLRVFARNDLWDFGPLEEFTQSIRSVDAEATGKPFGTVEGLKAMKNGLERAGVYAFLVIVAVLWLDFRRPRDTFIAVTPLVLGVLLSLGMLGLLGFPLNPANMIAFPLILGVGVDNGVHILHDYLIRQREGKPGVSRAIGRGVVVKALTTMIGFGTLMISTERGLAGLGFILTLGVGCSMVSAVVLLPAALHLLGRRVKQVEPEVIQPIRQAA
jgi:hopanoid biosynthesis associated RND transporter like protein HpnN